MRLNILAVIHGRIDEGAKEESPAPHVAPFLSTSRLGF
jgi:hypothetical protein